MGCRDCCTTRTRSSCPLRTSQVRPRHEAPQGRLALVYAVAAQPPSHRVLPPHVRAHARWHGWSACDCAHAPDVECWIGSAWRCAAACCRQGSSRCRYGGAYHRTLGSCMVLSFEASSPLRILSATDVALSSESLAVGSEPRLVLPDGGDPVQVQGMVRCRRSDRMCMTQAIGITCSCRDQRCPTTPCTGTGQPLRHFFFTVPSLMAGMLLRA